MDTVSIIQGILEYIDAHIKDDINADDLAARAGYSVWHFSRVFQWAVGYTVMSYVRGRRLAFAVRDMANGRKIINIALDYGFETHSGFSKAFRRVYGCSPETYRVHVRHEHTVNELADVLSPPNLVRMKNYLTGGVIMDPIFETRPVIKIAGFMIKTKSNGDENSKEIPKFWGAYMTDGRAARLHREGFIKNHAEYGACFTENHETGEFEYVIGVEIKDGAAVPSGYYSCEIPAATYALFSTPPSDAAGFVSAIQGTWQYIFNEWFPGSGYEYAPGCVDFELYDERCMTEKGKVCGIYIPVVEKKA